jgi:hypothetical protein
MAYNPATTYHGDVYIAATGQSIGHDIAAWQKEQSDEQKQKEFNVGQATILAQKGKMMPEDFQKFLTLPPDKQAGQLKEIERLHVEDFQERQLEQQGRIADLKDSMAGSVRDTNLAIAKFRRDMYIATHPPKAAAEPRAVTLKNGRVVQMIGDKIVPDKTSAEEDPLIQQGKLSTAVDHFVEGTIGQGYGLGDIRAAKVSGIPDDPNNIFLDIPAKTYPPNPETGFKGGVLPKNRVKVPISLYKKITDMGEELNKPAPEQKNVNLPAPNTTDGGSDPSGLSFQDRQAVAWARAHPNHPMSSTILGSMGIQ